MWRKENASFFRAGKKDRVNEEDNKCRGTLAIQSVKKKASSDLYPRMTDQVDRYFVLSCLVLSDLILSCLLLSYIILSYLVLSVLYCLVLYYLVFSSCLLFSCLLLSSLVFSWLLLSSLCLLACLVLCVQASAGISGWTFVGRARELQHSVRWVCVCCILLFVCLIW